MKTSTILLPEPSYFYCVILFISLDTVFTLTWKHFCTSWVIHISWVDSLGLNDVVWWSYELPKGLISDVVGKNFYWLAGNKLQGECISSYEIRYSQYLTKVSWWISVFIFRWIYNVHKLIECHLYSLLKNLWNCVMSKICSLNTAVRVAQNENQIL